MRLATTFTEPPATPGRSGARGFTMVEIAICLAVIAFGLVAIIGVLPRGLNAQRDNRAETIINQDAQFWMEAIRNSAKGSDELLDHVESIDSGGTVYTNGPPSPVTFSTGREIIGLLSRDGMNSANILALSGSAIEKPLGATEVAFKYRLRVSIEQEKNASPTNAPTPAVPGAQGKPAEVDNLKTWLWEVRLDFEWPLKNGAVGGGRQSYRSVVQANLESEQGAGGKELRFFVR